MNAGNGVPRVPRRAFTGGEFVPILSEGVFAPR